MMEAFIMYSPDDKIYGARQPGQGGGQAPNEQGFPRAAGREPYADAFVRAGQPPAPVPRYRYAQTPPMSQPTPGGQGRSRRGGLGAAGIIALCLVCAILGGAMGFGGAYFGYDRAAAEVSELPAASSAPAVAQPTPNAAQTQTPSAGASASPLLSSGVLTGSEIYNIGCAQTVGITSEYTTTNIFGQSSSAAVTGSGFIISADGYIITNYHVIEAAVSYGLEVEVMLYSGETYPAEIVGYEAANDVAVLKLDAEGLSAAAVGNSDTLEVGDAVYAIGNPLGELAYTMTTGIVSARDREISTSSSGFQGGYVTNNMFQIDAAVNSGNSGGPVYNDHGEVIGVVTAKYSSTGIEGLGFAIPINDAMNIATQLIQNGYVGGKAYFGVNVETVTAAAAQYYNLVPGAYVYNVTSGSCAEKAGIKIGDIITAIDDNEISSYADLLNAKRSYHAGDTVTVTIHRDGEELTLPLTFDEEVPVGS